MSRVDAFLATDDVALLETAAEVVAAANRWNYDGDIAVMRAMLAHPLAGRAAALTVFWLAGSELLADCETLEDAADIFDEEAAGWLSFCVEIQERVVQAEFPHLGFAFDPANHDGTDWTHGGDLSFPVADVMLQAISGRDWLAL